MLPIYHLTKRERNTIIQCHEYLISVFNYTIILMFLTCCWYYNHMPACLLHVSRISLTNKQERSTEVILHASKWLMSYLDILKLNAHCMAKFEMVRSSKHQNVDTDKLCLWKHVAYGYQGVQHSCRVFFGSLPHWSHDCDAHHPTLQW